MSEIINNTKKRVEELKRLILDLHKGVSVDDTKDKLIELMGSVPYGEVVQAEEELIADGLEREEVLKFCDIHTEALKGSIDTSGAKDIPEGHPVDIFIQENRAIQMELDKLKHLYHKISVAEKEETNPDAVFEIHTLFNGLMDIEKHYVRKENLIFSFLEKYEITGPPMVMWGKHDETRSFLKSSIELLSTNQNATNEELNGFFELIFNPTIKSIEEMIYKEEKILFPMCMDTFTDIDWYEIQNQSDDIGYCLYYPETNWEPDTIDSTKDNNQDGNRIKLSTGSFTTEELEAMFNNLPLDLTFVDKDDKVRYFSHGKERIFQRQKAILGRQVQFCHPPSSVHIVNQIVDDFKSGKQDEAKFWINFGGKFVHIAYYAVRNKKGEYLGTVELTQDIGEYRKIEGEKRILNYEE